MDQQTDAAPTPQQRPRPPPPLITANATAAARADRAQANGRRFAEGVRQRLSALRPNWGRARADGNGNNANAAAGGDDQDGRASNRSVIIQKLILYIFFVGFIVSIARQRGRNEAAKKKQLQLEREAAQRRFAEGSLSDVNERMSLAINSTVALQSSAEMKAFTTTLRSWTTDYLIAIEEAMIPSLTLEKPPSLSSIAKRNKESDATESPSKSGGGGGMSLTTAAAPEVAKAASLFNAPSLTQHLASLVAGHYEPDQHRMATVIAASDASLLVDNAANNGKERNKQASGLVGSITVLSEEAPRSFLRDTFIAVQSSELIGDAFSETEQQQQKDQTQEASEVLPRMVLTSVLEGMPTASGMVGGDPSGGESSSSSSSAPTVRSPHHAPNPFSNDNFIFGIDALPNGMSGMWRRIRPLTRSTHNKKMISGNNNNNKALLSSTKTASVKKSDGEEESTVGSTQQKKKEQKMMMASIGLVEYLDHLLAVVNQKSIMLSREDVRKRLAEITNATTNRSNEGREEIDGELEELEGFDEILSNKTFALPSSTPTLATEPIPTTEPPTSTTAAKESKTTRESLEQKAYSELPQLQKSIIESVDKQVNLALRYAAYTEIEQQVLWRLLSLIPATTSVALMGDATPDREILLKTGDVKKKVENTRKTTSAAPAVSPHQSSFSLPSSPVEKLLVTLFGNNAVLLPASSNETDETAATSTSSVSFGSVSSILPSLSSSSSSTTKGNIMKKIDEQAVMVGVPPASTTALDESGTFMTLLTQVGVFSRTLVRSSGSSSGGGEGDPKNRLSRGEEGSSLGRVAWWNPFARLVSAMTSTTSTANKKSSSSSSAFSVAEIEAGKMSPDELRVGKEFLKMVPTFGRRHAFAATAGIGSISVISNGSTMTTTATSKTIGGVENANSDDGGVGETLALPHQHYAARPSEMYAIARDGATVQSGLSVVRWVGYQQFVKRAPFVETMRMGRGIDDGTPLKKQTENHKSKRTPPSSSIPTATTLLQKQPTTAEAAAPIWIMVGIPTGRKIKEHIKAAFVYYYKTFGDLLDGSRDSALGGGADNGFGFHSLAVNQSKFSRPSLPISSASSPSSFSNTFYSDYVEKEARLERERNVYVRPSPASGSNDKDRSKSQAPKKSTSNVTFFASDPEGHLLSLTLWDRRTEDENDDSLVNIDSLNIGNRVAMAALIGVQERIRLASHPKETSSASSSRLSLMTSLHKGFEFAPKVDELLLSSGDEEGAESNGGAAIIQREYVETQKKALDGKKNSGNKDVDNALLTYRTLHDDEAYYFESKRDRDALGGISQQLNASTSSSSPSPSAATTPFDPEVEANKAFARFVNFRASLDEQISLFSKILLYAHSIAADGRRDAAAEKKRQQYHVISSPASSPQTSAVEVHDNRTASFFASPAYFYASRESVSTQVVKETSQHPTAVYSASSSSSASSGSSTPAWIDVGASTFDSSCVWLGSLTKMDLAAIQQQQKAASSSANLMCAENAAAEGSSLMSNALDLLPCRVYSAVGMLASFWSSPPFYLTRDSHYQGLFISTCGHLLEVVLSSEAYDRFVTVAVIPSMIWYFVLTSLLTVGMLSLKMWTHNSRARLLRVSPYQVLLVACLQFALNLVAEVFMQVVPAIAKLSRFGWLFSLANIAIAMTLYNEVEGARIDQYIQNIGDNNDRAAAARFERLRSFMILMIAISLPNAIPLLLKEKTASPLLLFIVPALFWMPQLHLAFKRDGAKGLTVSFILASTLVFVIVLNLYITNIHRLQLTSQSMQHITVTQRRGEEEGLQESHNRSKEQQLSPTEARAFYHQIVAPQLPLDIDDFDTLATGFALPSTSTAYAAASLGLYILLLNAFLLLLMRVLNMHQLRKRFLPKWLRSNVHEYQVEVIRDMAQLSALVADDTNCIICTGSLLEAAEGDGGEGGEDGEGQPPPPQEQEQRQQLGDGNSTGDVEMTTLGNDGSAAAGMRQRGNGDNQTSNTTAAPASASPPTAAASSVSRPPSLWVTPCHHYFHEKCLQQWMEEKMVCPLCRAPLPEP